VAEKLLTTDVTWNPHPPTPSPAGEGEQNPYYFLVPLSCGRGARGEGFTDFHVTPVRYNDEDKKLIKLKNCEIYFSSCHFGDRRIIYSILSPSR
jgi:hypothetical protein